MNMDVLRIDDLPVPAVAAAASVSPPPPPPHLQQHFAAYSWDTPYRFWILMYHN